MIKPLKMIALLVAISWLGACAKPVGYDYSKFLDHRPRSILVLPPINETAVYRAPYQYLAAITEPLAECGYYVFPVLLIEQLMKDNEITTVDAMHSLPLERIGATIGADAVLYTTIEQWGQTIELGGAITEVSIRFELVHVKSAEIIWQGALYSKVGTQRHKNTDQNNGYSAERNPRNVQQNIDEVAVNASYAAFADADTGLLVGPYRQIENQSHCPPMPMAFGGL